jgi:hypothetical protein
MYTISPATGAGALAESHCSDQLSVSTQEIVAGIDVIAARTIEEGIFEVKATAGDTLGW